MHHRYSAYVRYPQAVQFEEGLNLSPSQTNEFQGMQTGLYCKPGEMFPQIFHAHGRNYPVKMLPDSSYEIVDGGNRYHAYRVDDLWLIRQFTVHDVYITQYCEGVPTNCYIPASGAPLLIRQDTKGNYVAQIVSAKGRAAAIWTFHRGIDGWRARYIEPDEHMKQLSLFKEI